jgi:protein TonB
MLAATLLPNKAEVAGKALPRLPNPDVVTEIVSEAAQLPRLRPTVGGTIERVAEAPPPATAEMPAAAGSAAVAALPLRSGEAAVSAVSTVRAPAPNEGIDADGLRQFRLDLATQARRGKHYPAQALAAGWRGTAEVRLTIEGAGSVRDPELLRSSGYAVLDEAALDMLARAAPKTAIPESLYGRTFSVVLPVVFDVKGE